MPRGINKVIAVGNLGADPEPRYLPSGSVVTNFRLAVSDTWKDKQTGEQKERTEWMKIEVWGKAAEACAEYLRKGSLCYVEGRMQTDKWEDEEGKDRWTTKVRADNVQFLGGRGGPSDTNRNDRSPPPAPNPQADLDDDIPF